MEANKLLLMEMYNSLVFILSKKNNEVLESFSENKTTALSLIQNGQREIKGFRLAIDKVEPYTNFEEGFRKDFERIKEDISKITIK